MFECNYFWRAVYIGNQGHVFPCCHFQKDFESVDFKYTTDELHNTDFMQNLRQQAIDGIQPTGCNSCVHREKAGASPRTKSFEKFSNPTQISPAIDYEQIEYIDMRIGNTCNFMCVMCGVNNSHLIAKEKSIQGYLTDKPAISTWTAENEKRVFELLSKSKNLKSINIAGGEPFYNKTQMLKILEFLYPLRKTITIRLTTNGSHCDPQVLEKLYEFDNIQMSVSIDSVSNSNELQRWKANNKILKDNVNKMGEILTKIDQNIVLVPTISNLVLPDFTTLLDYALTNPHIIAINPTLLTWPGHMKVETIKQEQRKKIVDDIRSKYELHKDVYIKRKGSTWIKRKGSDFSIEKLKFLGDFQKFLDYVENAPAENQYDAFCKDFKKYEELRGLVVPDEFYNLLEK